MSEERSLTAKEKIKEQLLDRVARAIGSGDGGVRPAAVRELFSPDDDDMPMKTETPPRMVVTLVRLKLLEEARRLDRKKSLIQIFIEEYDKRMISYNRKGRLELLGALQALAESEMRGEIAIR